MTTGDGEDGNRIKWDCGIVHHRTLSLRDLVLLRFQTVCFVFLALDRRAYYEQEDASIAKETVMLRSCVSRL